MRTCSGKCPISFVLSLAFVLALVLCCTVSSAQQKPKPAPKVSAPTPVPTLPSGPLPSIGPPQALSPDKLGKAMELEARTVARQLKLDDEKTAKLLDAYKESRTSHRKAVEMKMAAGNGRGRENYEAFREIANTERAKLETALKGFLSEQEAAQAAGTLGSFSRRWDQMVIALDEMSLDENVKNQAMDAVANFVKKQSDAMRTAAGQPVDEETRKKNQQLREELDAEMAKILTPDQLAKWKQATARRGRN